MDLNMKLERKSSIRKLGRSKSTLLASEFINIPCGDTDYYERISQSMRHVEIIDDDEAIPIIRHKWKKKKNKAWVFLMKVFSFKKMRTSEECHVVGEKSMEVVDKIMNKKKTQSSSWERDGEITQKPDEVLVVEKKKIRQPTFLPDPYRRWPVQGWRY
ncbi:hypothetical protein MTR67_011515 [Solanum verrucosum]|uniref:Uncharacterized protein n=1 Tax=Solanum verrucosum TaxID=315347 RepID=A0AAF0TM24_SOLVR|nr:uncharacterized protein LOC125810309 [Solanum verrucosum]WMV18130.1 hypothetical protein MTR67_011515 [Solanum verrucosum]